MAMETVKELLSFDCGLLVAYQVYKSSQLDSISFQTSQMREVFLHHPEVVLIHRTHNPWGKALYMFMVDQPFTQLEGEMTKVIHFAVPTKESAEGLAQMYRTFKAFNPEWKQVKTFLVDPHFRWLQALSDAFPSADVQLSVFHICKHLQHKIQQVSLEVHTERLVLSALRNAMCAPSMSNLRKMYTILSSFVKSNRLPQLHRDWLLNEKIWALHRWRTWGQCSQYFKDLEMVTRSLSQIFCVGPSLETCITRIAKNYQKAVQKSSLESAPGPVVGENGSFAQNLLVLRSSVPNSRRLLLPKLSAPTAPPAPLKPAAEVPVEGSARKEEAETPSREAEERIKQSLSDICTEPAARLCLNEFAAVQSSAQLVGNNGETASIQILEDVQVVRQKGVSSSSSCTCHFSQTFQLPCRHILAVLNSEGKEFEPGRIPARWRKGNGISQEGQNGTDGLLEVLSCSWDELLDKYLAVSFLTAEISRLLSQCSQEEFDRRYSTLRELADSWIGPYVQVKL